MEIENFFRRSFDGLEIVRFDCTDVEFKKHAHDEYVIGANVIGREYIWLDGRRYEASVDDATLYNPGEVQAATARGYEWGFYSLYVDVEFIRRALSEEQSYFQKPVVAHAGLAARIRHLCARSLGRDFVEEEIIEATVSLLGDTFSERSVARRSERLVCPSAKRTAERLLDTMGCPPKLFELASAESLSTVQLVRRFTAAYGTPPFTWLNVQRLKAARRMLAGNMALSEVAHDLGFSDQAHFTRRFKAMYSVTPGVWLKSV
jgi:AraC family transcriptional regulator, chemosensory pili system protein ChpD